MQPCGTKVSYVIPSVCSLALLVGGVVAISPLVDNKVYADENIVTAVDPVINLTIAPDTGNTNNNVQVGEVAYFSNTITVGGTGISKYYLTLSTPSGSTGNLVGQSNPAATVGKVGTGTSPTNFSDNTWGYAVSTNISAANSSLTYNPVPSGTGSGSNVAHLASKTSALATSGDKYKLVFAAKLGSNMPNDHYKADVYVSAVANAYFVMELDNNWFVEEAGITDMQQMTTSICDSAPINATSILTDTRDGRKYWVTKLKDGNCWMTQNLAYNGGGTRQCTLSSGTTCSGWPNSRDGTARYAAGSHTDGEHTSLGNLYSWEAAMNNDTSATGNVQGICPDRWQLPMSSKGNKSFKVLTEAYNVGNNKVGSEIMRGAPMFFQFSGYVSNGSLRFVGTAGYYWSSTTGSTSAYFLAISASDVDPSSIYSHHEGYSVRCVAQ